MMHNYGQVHPTTHVNNNSFIMRLLYPNLHNSFVTFRVDATDLSLVINTGRGRIVSAKSHGFNESTNTAGRVVVVVENLGDVTQDFSLLLNECFGRASLPAKTITVYPGYTEAVTFHLIGNNKEDISVECEGIIIIMQFIIKMIIVFSLCNIVQLFDQNFALLGTARLTFNVKAPCFCFGVCDCTVSKSRF